MSRAYYNEFDPKAAAWLRELIKAGLIAPGDVDDRSICDVRADDLNGYTQCHFFAGIGGWSYALRIAGWPDDRPVWTGSCPCQSFSSAGKKKGHGDSRNLWPEMLRLVRVGLPSTLFGEQVTRAINYGWLDGVSTDLEAEDYAFGAAVLGAYSVRAPHGRSRIFFVANRINQGLEKRQEQSARQKLSDPKRSGDVSGMADAMYPAKARYRKNGDEVLRHQATDELRDSSLWSKYELVYCRDGYTRRIEPGVLPMADGIPARVVKIRGYGNAIVPQLAAQFIQAAEEAIATSSPAAVPGPAHRTSPAANLSGISRRAG